MEHVFNITEEDETDSCSRMVKALTGPTGYRDTCKSEQENAKLLQIDAVCGVQIVCDTGKWVKLWRVKV